jgi:starch synthase
MKVLLAHPGTQYSFRLAAELQRRGALSAFYTGLAFAKHGWIDRLSSLMPAHWRRRLANRCLAGVPSKRLYRRPASELAAMWRLRRGCDSQQVWHRRAEQFQQSISDGALTRSSAVIGFDTASWVLAKRSTFRGIPFILDQSIGHPDAKVPAYALVRQQYPTWIEGVAARRPEVRAAEQVEHDTAVAIVAASSFTRRTLIDHGVAEAKIRVNPYGVDTDRFEGKHASQSRCLRFIFVGLINARKGVPLLFEAWHKLRASGAELWLVGSASKQVLPLLPETRGVKHFGRVPHEEVPALMQQCDVFVFPSYFEGFGLVLLEAMASGLPVITTTATSGPDILTEGEDGWIIEPGDLSSLVQKMTFCLEHPQIVREMGMRARSTAERFTWSAYGNRWIQILSEVCK